MAIIESKDVLALCDRFQEFLVPLDIHVLRQRYNGLIVKSTYAVGREMHISDETVRTIENRALDAIAHGLDLESNGQDITPMRLAKSFRQPTARRICAGREPIVTAAAYTAHRGERLIVASRVHREASQEDLPLGAIIGRCLLVDWYRGPLPHPHPHKSCLNLEQPEAFPEPIRYAGEPSSFDVNHEVAQPLPTRDACSLKRTCVRRHDGSPCTTSRCTRGPGTGLLLRIRFPVGSSRGLHRQHLWGFFYSEPISLAKAIPMCGAIVTSVDTLLS